MKAFVLIGGKATRLEPLTLNTPKALIPTLNVPFLEWVIQNLSSQGITDIVLGLGHMARAIEEYLGDGSRLGVKLYYSVEDTPLGSAGAAKLAERFLDETFLVFNGDNFIDLDIGAMASLHREKKARVTIALTRVDDPTSYGLVETGEGGRVLRFLEKPKAEEVTTDTVNAGAWLVEPEVMSLVPAGTPYSFERNVFPELLAKGEPFSAHTSGGYWMDAGTPEKYLQLHRDLLNGKSRQYSPSQDLSVGENTKIHPTAEIRGQVVIGPDCTVDQGVTITGPVVIGTECTIEADCRIEDTVIWQNTRLEPRVNLTSSIVANDCLLMEGSAGQGFVVAEKVTVERGVTIEPGSRIGPGERVQPVA